MSTEQQDQSPSLLRRPRFLSPSALDLWLKNEEQYFTKYLAVDRPPSIPQTPAMSVGSAFDAYVKAFLHQRLFGKNHADSPQFEFDKLFETQVESHNRDFGLKAGGVCFVAYRESGALGKLLEALGKSAKEPMFEFTKQGIVDDTSKGVYRSIGGPGKVVILGKPDVFFTTKSGINIILDWKVNGYCSGSGKNPTPGYLWLLDGFNPPSKKHGATHKDAVPHEEDGFEYSLHPNIEHQEVSWARQLCAYSWLCGAEVGSEILVGIDQLSCKPSHPSPMISVAQHRCPITKEFQTTTYQQFQDCWDTIQSDHIFRKLSREESQNRVSVLLNQGAAFKGGEDKHEWLKSWRTHN